MQWIAWDHKQQWRNQLRLKCYLLQPPSLPPPLPFFLSFFPLILIHLISLKELQAGGGCCSTPSIALDPPLISRPCQSNYVLDAPIAAHGLRSSSVLAGLIIGGPWSPSNLDSWGKMWCFTILHWIGKSSAGSKPKVTRRTVDKSSTWYSDHGRQIRKQYPDDLMVNSLRTKKPINSRFFSMMEITLRCQEPALVALCKIKIKAGTKAPASSGRMVAAEQQEVDTAATSMEIGLHQEDLASQHGANVEANMDPAIIASDTNEGRIHPEEFRGQYSLDVLGVSWEDLDDLPPSLLDDDWGDLLDQPPSFLDGCGDILDQPPFLLDDDLGDLLGQPPSFLDDE